MRIIVVGGARPNFVKVAPLLRALGATRRFSSTFVHTGQHYDEAMSAVFLAQLGLPAPAFELGIGSGTHAAQTAAVMTRFEPVLREVQPHVVVVVGDVNSTLACALTASKFTLERPFTSGLGPRTRPIVAHVEAGLRSGDLDMPEEINRRATDAIADVLFTTEASAGEHLRREGIADEQVHFVGNLMIDSLLTMVEAARAARAAAPSTAAGSRYLLLTLHRPGNVDDADHLRALLAAVEAGAAADGLPIVFPVHPRTRARLAAAGVALTAPRWHLIDPVGYLEFVGLMDGAAVVATDSGGIQEETTVLGVPCVTLRTSTERPVTVSHGTNRLAGTDPAAITAAVRAALAAPSAPRPPPPLWDGQTAPRIVAVLERLVPAST